jgi:hypothetical protein
MKLNASSRSDPGTNPHLSGCEKYAPTWLEELGDANTERRKGKSRGQLKLNTQYLASLVLLTTGH